MRAEAERVAQHLVTLPMVAREHGLSPLTVAIWAERYPHFPKPIFAPSPAVRVYLRPEVEGWIATMRTYNKRFATRYKK